MASVVAPRRRTTTGVGPKRRSAIDLRLNTAPDLVRASTRLDASLHTLALTMLGRRETSMMQSIACSASWARGAQREGTGLGERCADVS